MPEASVAGVSVSVRECLEGMPPESDHQQIPTAGRRSQGSTHLALTRLASRFLQSSRSVLRLGIVASIIVLKLQAFGFPLPQWLSQARERPGKAKENKAPAAVTLWESSTK